MELLALVVPAGREWAAVGLSYLLGSVAFGLLLGFARGVDIRRHGSGNVGATNAGRVLGRPYAYLAFAGDLLKGWLPAFGIGRAMALGPERELALAVWCGAAAVCGHVLPIWFGFRGGKGVATGCGAVLGIDPLVFLGGGAAWLAAIALFRFVGLASIAMAVAFVVFAWWRASAQDTGPELVLGTAALAALVLWRHRSNVGRMLAGTEPRVGKRTVGGGSGEGP